MPIILISYRRADSKDMARLICDRLMDRYGKNSVYIDIDSIQPSADYRQHITRSIQRALVVLAVIGQQWSGPRADGSFRIFDRDDPVRTEVETALTNRRAVMPVLVNGTAMPAEADVPRSLKRLPYLNAVQVRSGEEFASDMKRLFRAIDQLTAQFWTLYAALYLVLPFVLLLLSQYLILFKIDTDPLYLRLAVAAISAVLGLGLCFHAGFRAGAALLTAAAVGFAAMAGMLTIEAALSNPSAPLEIRDIIPSIGRDWQEVVEYFGTVTAVTLSSNVLGWLFRDSRSRSDAVGP